MNLIFKAGAAALALACCSAATAEKTYGFADTNGVTGGGDLATAKVVVIRDYNTLVNYLGNTVSKGGLQGGSSTKQTVANQVIVWAGNEDAQINTIKNGDFCSDSLSVVDPATGVATTSYMKTSRSVYVKYLTNLTIIGAPGSSANFGFNVVGSNNIIIRNMKIGMQPGRSGSDGVTVDSTTNVWVDHNEMFTRNFACPGQGDTTFDGLIDIKKTADNVTVSYNYFHDHHKTGLDGYTSSDVARNVTYHHNYYDNVGARLPLQRNGFIHVWNNFYNRVGYEDASELALSTPTSAPTGFYGTLYNGTYGSSATLAPGSGINVRQGGQALIQNNWFQNAINPVTCRYDDSNCGTWDLRNNNVLSPSDFGTYNIKWTDDTSSGTPAGQYAIDTAWSSTARLTVPSYMVNATMSPAVCVKNNLFSVAGYGKTTNSGVAASDVVLTGVNASTGVASFSSTATTVTMPTAYNQLTSATCSGTSSSSSSSVASSSSSSSSSVSSSSSSTASSSSSSSSSSSVSSSSSSSSSSVAAPVCTAAFTCDSGVGAQVRSTSVTASGVGYSYGSGTYTVTGAGAMGSSASYNHYLVYMPLTGDFVMTARLVTQGGSNDNARAGLLATDSLTAGSGSFAWTARFASTTDIRASLNGNNGSDLTGFATSTVPVWVRIQRIGTAVTSWASKDGVTWASRTGTNGITTSASTLYVGFAVSSASNTATATASFDNLTVTQNGVTLPAQP